MPIVLAIVGTPSPVSYGVFDVLRTTARFAAAEFVILSANSVTEFESAVSGEEPGSKALVVISDYPQTDLLALLQERGAPIVVCMERFETIAHHFVVARGYSGVDAARHATNALVNLEETVVFKKRNVAVVNHANVSIFKLVGALGAILGMTIDRSKQIEIVRSLAPEGGETTSIADYAVRFAPDVSAAPQILDQRSPLEDDLLDFLAPFYDVIFHRRRLEALEWPPFALLRPDLPDRLTVGPIDLTGPARFIYYGPYFALPRGRWRADIVVEVSDCHSDNRIAIDVASGGVLAALTAKLPPQGVFGCAIAFEIRNPSDPVEIRMQLLTGAIEGALMLRRVHLTRSASAP